MSDQSYQPTLSHLRAFVSIAEFRHFGTAAARLGVSQPTLSQALAALENGLGLQLIERSTRRVLVTAAGQRLLPHAMATIEAAHRFLTVARGTGESLTGTLRMGLIPTVAPYMLPALLPMLRSELPDLELQVIEDQTAVLLDRLRSGVVDVAVLALPTNAHGMSEIPLFDEGFVLVVPPGHELAGRLRLNPKVLNDIPLLLLDEGHCLRDQALDLCRSADARPAPVGDTRAASLSTVVQCVAGGLGVTLIPDMAVSVETSRAELGIARFAGPVPGRTLGLVFRSSSIRSEDYERLALFMRQLRNGSRAAAS
ncbi:LysR substrate-binding domain-containing protein [Aldersonia sp. NBC_00410]|uniref:LysR substrate-binding domain-containing protein n=1 Tax=Aldersonia sp. NBC_00410 TaxID=2975954 RepID=UPI00225969DA|nr:LysR substrate-binding domain-containing protein [Aldersonia sp. NBC_00410]MCX5042597.1 LysR substrate-binding domain-containing protein [Aldersonia sp. NBC_00410]